MFLKIGSLSVSQIGAELATSLRMALNTKSPTSSYCLWVRTTIPGTQKGFCVHQIWIYIIQVEFKTSQLTEDVPVITIY